MLLSAACDDDPAISDGIEGQYCSIKATDDPFYPCRSTLVCVNTYHERVFDPEARVTIPVPIFVCRAPCDADGGACRAGEVCCAGTLADGQTRQACVPEGRCESPVGDRDAGPGGGPVDGPADRPVYRSHEGQYCSTSPDDDPIYECTPPLVCLNTYDQLVPGGDGGPRTVPIYLCRMPCQSGAACPVGDICCGGVLATGQVQQACVPEGRCDPQPRDR